MDAYFLKSNLTRAERYSDRPLAQSASERRTDISVNRTTDTQAEAKHSELSLETPDELPLGTADELPLEIPDGPSRSDRQAVGSDTPPRKKKKTTAFKGSASYSTKFDCSWSRKYGCADAMREDPFCFFCTVCKKKVSCKHQGELDVKRHIASTSHGNFAQQLQTQRKLGSPDDIVATKTIKAEVKISTMLAQRNIPLAFADHLSPMIGEIFDGQVAKGYSCARTKSTAILNHAVAPALKSELVSAMRSSPFSILIDGSNDTGLEKMNPLTIKIFDIGRGRVESRFLDMCTCTTTGTTSATAESIFTKMDQVLSSCTVPLTNCVGFGVDNASVNIGKHNSIRTRVLRSNPSTYFLGCPCHLAHNTASTAADCLSRTTGFDVEEMAVDLYYWFDKSTKRKSTLEDYCVFCDVTYIAVIRHVSTRWLSLATAVERALKLYEGLRSYFLSEHESQARFRRLSQLFGSPVTEVYLLFYQSVLPLFTHFNLLLQREDPCIHILHSQCMELLRKLLVKFVRVAVIKATTHQTEIDYNNKDNQLPDSTLFIGFTTRQKLQKLEREGDISPLEVKKFIDGVRKYYEAATKYVLDKFPLNDDTLKHARFVEFDRRAHADLNFTDVEYFANRYSAFLKFTPKELDALFDEFADYQLLESADISGYIWKAARAHYQVEEGDEETKEAFPRIDVIWAFLTKMKSADGCRQRFANLARIAQLVLVLPHSNAGEERIFSLVRLNKTSYRSSLSLDGTLSSILTIKTHIPDSFIKFDPPKEMLEKAKKATTEYNKKHRKEPAKT